MLNLHILLLQNALYQPIIVQQKLKCKRLPKVYEIENFSLKMVFLYSMKIKEQTRKLAVGCSKHCFEVVDRTDIVSILHIRQGETDVV